MLGKNLLTTSHAVVCSTPLGSCWLANWSRFLQGSNICLHSGWNVSLWRSILKHKDFYSTPTKSAIMLKMLTNVLYTIERTDQYSGSSCQTEKVFVPLLPCFWCTFVWTQYGSVTQLHHLFLNNIYTLFTIRC